jgi:hypothetical protein
MKKRGGIEPYIKIWWKKNVEGREFGISIQK